MTVSTTILEQQSMGRVLTLVTVENLRDLWAAEERRIPSEAVRRIEIPEALVDTGATTLALPTRFIHELGLSKTREQNAVSAHRPGTTQIYEAVRLTMLGRNCVVEVMEVPNEVPALIGQIPLGMLDLVINRQGRRLTGNPAHNGEHVLELL